LRTSFCLQPDVEGEEEKKKAEEKKKKKRS